VRAEKKLKAVASFSIVGDFVQQIGGERVEVSSLVGPNGDAHVFSPTPNHAKAVLEAKIVNGLGLKGWLERLVKTPVLATNPLLPDVFLSRQRLESPRTVNGAQKRPLSLKIKDQSRTFAAGTADQHHLVRGALASSKDGVPMIGNAFQDRCRASAADSLRTRESRVDAVFEECIQDSLAGSDDEALIAALKNDGEPTVHGRRLLRSEVFDVHVAPGEACSPRGRFECRQHRVRSAAIDVGVGRNVGQKSSEISKFPSGLLVKIENHSARLPSLEFLKTLLEGAYLTKTCAVVDLP
jgi:hypothetical protein